MAEFAATMSLEEAGSYVAKVIERAKEDIYILCPGTSPSVFDFTELAIKKALMRNVRILAILPGIYGEPEANPLYHLHGRFGFILFLSPEAPDHTAIVIDSKTVFIDKGNPLIIQNGLSFTLYVNDLVVSGKILRELKAIRNKSRLYHKK